MVMSVDHGNDNLEDVQGQVEAATDIVTPSDATCWTIALHRLPYILLHNYGKVIQMLRSAENAKYLSFENTTNIPGPCVE